MEIYILNDIKMKERQYHHLSNIPETFYTDLAQTLSSLKEEVARGEKEMYLYTNFCIITSEIIERRLNKLMNRAYMYSMRNHSLTSNTGEVEMEVPRNAVSVEAEFFKELLDDFAKFYDKWGCD